MNYTRLLKKGSRGEDVKAVQTALHCLPDGIFGDLTTEAVKDWQETHGLGVDGIVGRLTWDSLFPSSTTSATNLKKSKRSINMIIVHCTATIEGKEYSVAEVRKWHLKRGFSDIGYHYLVGLNGRVHEGRNVNISGAHTAGYNAHSIGVCYVGGLDKDGKAKDTRTPAQKAALKRLLTDLKKMYPHASIHGHREFANKACPCFDARAEYKGL